ncbi:predicted Fe-S-cluster oxidoreductase [Hahella chejuensis KCTC 2396]|uniref:Predicted Fe-S-cluster oxidoreductase n=1 Tax=Hahella chejuensis (strain KCTC 2396) TaxID=349521 RepID=Q2SMY6_HAHCH|nr:YkgJ family cysteine cluster protein [Hahella chejuensis]ABC27988.1 predicted Fe-S-cluster oxidoreductase [Hahella chejuensis KCTC 2396]
MSVDNPCLSCGACCASFRVSFYWAEADAESGGVVPLEFTEKLNPWRSVMIGTNQPQPRCHALCGDIGGYTTCSIYEQRPTPCREFEAGSEGCLKARAKHGLSLDLSDWRAA